MTRCITTTPFHTVFCFKTAEDAQTFAEQFGGKVPPLKPR
jgi:hypothetical protein